MADASGSASKRVWKAGSPVSRAWKAKASNPTQIEARVMMTSQAVMSHGGGKDDRVPVMALRRVCARSFVCHSVFRASLRSSFSF